MCCNHGYLYLISNGSSIILMCCVFWLDLQSFRLIRAFVMIFFNQAMQWVSLAVALQLAELQPSSFAFTNDDFRNRKNKTTPYHS